MKTLISIVLEIINWDIKTIETLKNKFEEDFMYAFEWKSEQLFKFIYKQKKLQGLANFIEDKPEKTEEWLKYNIEIITNCLLQGKSTFNSTSTFHNLSEAYSKECDAELLTFYKEWLIQITDKGLVIKEGILTK